MLQSVIHSECHSSTLFASLHSVQAYNVFSRTSDRAVIGRRALNRGERLLRFSLNELENDLVAYQERGNRKNH